MLDVTNCSRPCGVEAGPANAELYVHPPMERRTLRWQCFFLSR
jgi:hypothetical protein